MIPFSPMGFLRYPYLLIFCKEERIKVEVVEEFVINVLRGFITGLPCKVVNFQSAVRVRYGYSILQVVDVV